MSPTAPFPWPAADATQGALEAACDVPEGRIRAGLAVEQDVWQSVICEVPRLKPENVDAFVQGVTEFLSHIPNHFSAFPVATLPPDWVKQYDAKDVQSWGRATIVLADAKAIARYPVLGIAHKLESGGIRGVCAPWNKAKGHYEVTSDVARNRLRPYNLAFSRAAADVLADASQDPDLFDWNTMAAHGQTPATDAGRPATGVADAQKAWASFVNGYVSQARTMCEQSSPDVRRALYFTGYALHAVEDVAPHRGRTNPEHAYDSEVLDKNPDTEENAIALAADMATQFLAKALAGPLSSCAAAFAAYNGFPVTYLEKITTFHKHLQLTLGAILTYRQSWKLFDSIAKETDVSVRWFGRLEAPRDCSGVECTSLLAMVGNP